MSPAGTAPALPGSCDDAPPGDLSAAADDRPRVLRPGRLGCHPGQSQGALLVRARHLFRRRNHRQDVPVHPRSHRGDRLRIPHPDDPDPRRSLRGDHPGREGADRYLGVVRQADAHREASSSGRVRPFRAAAGSAVRTASAVDRGEAGSACPKDSSADGESRPSLDHPGRPGRSGHPDHHCPAPVQCPPESRACPGCPGHQASPLMHSDETGRSAAAEARSGGGCPERLVSRLPDLGDGRWRAQKEHLRILEHQLVLERPQPDATPAQRVQKAHVQQAGSSGAKGEPCRGRRPPGAVPVGSPSIRSPGG